MAAIKNPAVPQQGSMFLPSLIQLVNQIFINYY